MCTGILQLGDDDLLHEVIAASDYFQLTALKEGLDLKYKYHIVPSNVFNWAKVADRYNMPQMTDMCDRIQLVKFLEVVQHDEYRELPKVDVLKYFEKCKQYSGISSDDLLQAALTWMKLNEPFPELIRLIDLSKCAESTLETAANHPAMPRNIVPVTEFDETVEDKEQTLVYVTDDRSVFVDRSGQQRVLLEIEYGSPFSFATNHRVCHTNDGYMLIDEAIFQDNNQKHWKTYIAKFDTTKDELEILPGDYEGKTNVCFSIIRKDKVFVFPGLDNYLLSYDLKENMWSKIVLPEELEKDLYIPSCEAAVIDDDLYFTDSRGSRLCLFRLHEGKLEQIQTDFQQPDAEIDYVSITAVHRWLYIFARTARDTPLHVHCYDTSSGIWTDIHVDFSIHHEMDVPSSMVFENKIYFLGHSGTDCFLARFYEYNLANDRIQKTTRPYPRCTRFHLSVIDVAKGMLEVNSEANIYREEQIWYEDDSMSESV